MFDAYTADLDAWRHAWRLTNKIISHMASSSTNTREAAADQEVRLMSDKQCVDQEARPKQFDFCMHGTPYDGMFCNICSREAPVVDGIKYDGNKIDPTFVIEYFPRALLAIAAVSEYGARKYARGNWRLVDNGIMRYGAALVRHQLATHIEGPYDDSDSGLPHLAQQAWNTLAVLEKALELGVIEMRRGNEIKDGAPILGSAKKIA